jgi:hypothetical protein
MSDNEKIEWQKGITERIVSDLGTFGCAVTYTNEQGELTYVNPKFVPKDFIEPPRRDVTVLRPRK